MGFCFGGILVGSGQWWRGGYGGGVVVVTGQWRHGARGWGSLDEFGRMWKVRKNMEDVYACGGELGKNIFCCVEILF